MDLHILQLFHSCLTVEWDVTRKMGQFILFYVPFHETDPIYKWGS